MSVLRVGLVKLALVYNVRHQTMEEGQKSARNFEIGMTEEIRSVLRI